MHTSVKSLPLMAQNHRVRRLKRGSAQLAHIVNIMFTTLETKGILRSALEEFMLSSMYKAHDELAAEFLRTCRHEQLLGCKLLELYDGMASEEGLRETISSLSKHSRRTAKTDSQSVYGYRPQHPDTWFLSPWEFCQWFKVI